MPENTKKQDSDGYDFVGLRFSPEHSKIICLETRKEIFLRRNLSEFLLLLLKKPRGTIEYQEFCESVAAWTIYKDVSQVMRTIHTTKGELVKNLRLLREDFDLIEAVPAKGYRLSADVSEFFTKTDKTEISLEKPAELNYVEPEKTVPARDIFGGHLQQAFFASAIYAALFVVALFLEIAYQFDAFKLAAFYSALPVFLWIWLSSAAGLFFGAKFSKKSVFYGFVCTAAVFLCAAILLSIALGAVLPEYPVTEANFQTYPAHAAYLKDIFYFLGLGVFLVALPFIVVVRLETEAAKNGEKAFASWRRLRRRGLSAISVLSVSPASLLGLTIFALASSFVLTAHLLDNLKTGSYHNLFVQLVLWRWFLYFALAAECLIWYQVSLNRIKSNSFQNGGYFESPSKTNVAQ